MRLQWATAFIVGLILLSVLGLVRRRRQPQQSGIRFSTIDRLRRQGNTFAGRVRRFIPALRWLAMVVLVLAIARPQKGNEQQRIAAEGIAIQMVLDISGSMRALDFQLGGKQADRITAAKNVMRDFVRGGQGLRGRPDDLIGLITFARYADSKVPLTLDHANLLRVLDDTQAIRYVVRNGQPNRFTVITRTERRSATHSPSPLRDSETSPADEGKPSPARTRKPKARSLSFLPTAIRTCPTVSR